MPMGFVNPNRGLEHEVSSVSGHIAQETLDILFAALLLTAFGSFIAGNLLLLESAVLWATAPVTLYCIALLLVYYAATSLVGLPWATALIWLAIVGLVWLRHPLVVNVAFWAASTAAAVFALRNLRIERPAIWTVMLMAILGVATSFSSFGVYTYFDNLNVARSGLIHKDVLFHSAIAAMIKNYGVVSTGLHGLVETPYYVLSHCVAALGSLVSGRGTFEVYGVLTFVLLIPLVIFAAAACAVAIDERCKQQLPLVWVMVCVLLVVCPAIFGAWQLRDYFFMSESYMLSVAILMLALPLLFVKRLGVREIVVLGLLTAVMAYTKASTAVIFVGLAGSRWLILAKGRSGSDLGLFAALVSVLALFVFGITGAADTAHSWGLLDYVRRTSWQGKAVTEVWNSLLSGRGPTLSIALLATASVVTFFAFHFILSWVVVVGSILRRGWTTLWREPAVVYSWAAILGGSLFVLFFVRTNASDVYWFTNISFFVSLPVVAAGAARRLEMFPVKQWFLLLVGMGVVAAFSYTSYYKNSRWAPLRSVKHKSALVEALVSIRSNEPVNVVMKAPRHAWGWEPVLWGTQPWYTAAPFFYPAISERSWINVIRPEKRGDPYKDYTFAAYEIDLLHGGVTSPPVLAPEMTLVESLLPKAPINQPRGQ